MRQLGAILVALVFLAACGQGSEGAACGSDLECTGELRCFDERCLDLGQPEGRIVWQVLPSAASGQVAATFATQDNPLDLHLCAAQRVTGSLGFPGAARLVAEGELGGVPGACAGFERRVEGAFSFPLAAGLWRLSLHPADGAPPVVRMLEVSRCKDLDLGSIEAAEKVRSLRFLPLIDPALDPRPRCGIRARVLEPATGLPLSAALEIAVDEDGVCRLPPAGLALPFREPEGGGKVLLRLEALEAASPTLRGVAWEIALPPEGPVELGALAVGSEAPERVLIALRNPQGAPVRDAKVRGIWPPPERPAAPSCFQKRRATGAGEPSFFHSPVAEPTEEWGVYELWLPPGPYLLEAEAPEGVLLAAGGRCGEDEAACAIVVRSGETQRVGLELSERIPLRGRVLLPQGSALPGARVLAAPRGREGPERAAVADSAGRYELFLDPGAYDLLVDPGRLDLPLSRHPLPSPLVAPRELNLGVARPALVAGQVRAVAGEESLPIAEALVRAWRLDGGERPVLAGETLSDGAGRFYLTLPAR